MKTIKLFGVLSLLLIGFSLMSCNKDDEIEISQLIGEWSVINDDPRLSVDGAITYTFNADKSCSIYSYDFLSDRDTTINRIYTISIGNDLVTLFNEEGYYTEQYHIRKLTSKEMRWENASPGDGNSDKKLVRFEE
jgi:hypothetical protein